MTAISHDVMLMTTTMSINTSICVTVASHCSDWSTALVIGQLHSILVVVTLSVKLVSKELNKVSNKND